MPICVCSQHFVGGVKAYLHDRTSPAWLPSLHLGKSETSSPVPNVHLANDRFLRSSQRKHKRALSQHIDYSKSVTEEHSASHDISAQCDAGSTRLIEALENEKFNIRGLYSFNYYENNNTNIGFILVCQSLNF
ncbi:hypothetical protein ACJMK2_005896 [Sinanodonta woodiana]|uniref:Uncharacterized protein n=1 Tax=Sinanodonta woodiana TaxID=1069815 RepID=A0ABD3VV06_SINWO